MICKSIDFTLNKSPLSVGLKQIFRMYNNKQSLLAYLPLANAMLYMSIILYHLSIPIPFKLPKVVQSNVCNCKYFLSSCFLFLSTAMGTEMFHYEQIYNRSTANIP